MKGGTTPKTYTRFSVPINQILRDLKDKPWFKPPPPLKGNTSKMDQTKYCAFHKGPRHIINDCTTWRRATNNLKKRKIQQVRSINQFEAVDAVSRLIVNFTEHDAEGVDFPHDDALVISVQLAHSIVDRVMMDNGSSINLLQLSIIQKMSLESTIQRKAEVLTGFNELTSTAIGTITLDVTSPPIVTLQTFMIVSDPSLHNGILSRPCLVKIGAMTSIEYQKI
ncbi:unnamed protein product [Malus baccata var. baccata]